MVILGVEPDCFSVVVSVGSETRGPGDHMQVTQSPRGPLVSLSVNWGIIVTSS